MDCGGGALLRHSLNFLCLLAWNVEVELSSKEDEQPSGDTPLSITIYGDQGHTKQYKMGPDEEIKEEEKNEEEKTTEGEEDKEKENNDENNKEQEENSKKDEVAKEKNVHKYEVRSGYYSSKAD